MATPASRFRPVPEPERGVLALRLPPQLSSVLQAPAETIGQESSTPEPAEGGVISPDAVEIDRVVPPSGNLGVAGQQFWLGRHLVGTVVRLWIDTTTVHLSVGGRRLKTLPSRMTTNDLERLRKDGGRPAGPPPSAPSAIGLGGAIEVDRSVNAVGVLSLGRVKVSVGQPLAGRRVTLRLDGDLIHVVADGVLVRTLASPLPPERRARIPGARVAGPPPKIDPEPTRVQRRVSERGGIQVASQRVQVGLPHARSIVTVEVDDAIFRVLDDEGEVLKVVPRTTTEEVIRFKAHGHRAREPRKCHPSDEAKVLRLT
jgi:hypothetical protein